MNEKSLSVENLYIQYNQGSSFAVNNISLKLQLGESIGIIGESGSGKSSIGKALMGLLNKEATVKGEIYYNHLNLNAFDEKKWNEYRWDKIAIVFQNSLDILNPVLTLKEQIEEAIIRHKKEMNKETRLKTIIDVFNKVKLDYKWVNRYPHQISGGMRQKFLIAMALSCDPDILIIDEPTTALDSLSKKEIVDLLNDLKKEKSMIIISHEIQIIEKLTSKVIVMYLGNIVEQGNTTEVINNPFHPYTRGLVGASPEVNTYRDLWGIPGEIEGDTQNNTIGCPFYNRCNQRINECARKRPEIKKISNSRQISCVRGGIVTILKAENISKTYKDKNQKIPACHNCNIVIKSGEVVAVIGETGSGKSTLAEILIGVLNPDTGKILFENREVVKFNETSKKNGMQMIFQDPLSATNEKLTVEEVISEPLEIQKIGNKEDRINEVKKVLKDVQLPQDEHFLKNKCYKLSGGQRQRVAIARSLILEPKVLIADEISSMLDPSTQANIIRLLKGLQNKKGFSMLYITHDLALSRKIADRIYVMYKGDIVEEGNAKNLLNNPKKEYTRNLIKASGIL